MKESSSIIVQSKRRSVKNIEKEYPGSKIIDVTSKSSDEFVQLSPFYPHGNIPVPFSENYTAMSVEGIWQGLKVFSEHDIDISKFSISSMKGIKRTVRKYGAISGHRKGVNGKDIISYLEARKCIYLPSYIWVLENKTTSLVKRIDRFSKEQTVILLDYETNSDINNLKKPLSHAALIKIHIDGLY